MAEVVWLKLLMATQLQKLIVNVRQPLLCNDHVTRDCKTRLGLNDPHGHNGHYSKR